MNQAVVIIGVGEIGGVLARGLLRTGHPVYPITRAMDMASEVKHVPRPLAVVVAVAEKDLHPALQAIPGPWRDRVVLLQNELLPRDWESPGYSNPTVASVWFEKKPGQDSKVLLPSPVFGPNARLIVDALTAVGIPARELETAEELLYELVRKNVYILTTNIAGLECNGTVSELWQKHEHIAREVAGEVIDIQDWLTGTHHDRRRLIAGMLEGFEGDPGHRCLGRSAPARLERALRHADEAGLAVKKLRAIHAQA